MQSLQLHPQERRQAGEEEIIDKLIPVLKSLIEKPYLTGTTYRDTHAKGHAALRATFTVEADLPPELRVGLFAKPRTYAAWVRCANLSPVPQNDAKRDIRAMAIKLMDVDGDRLWQSEPDARTLDLVMMGSQTFLAPNLQVFYDLEVALLKGGSSVPLFFLTHPRVFLTISRSQQKTANMLQIPYFSQTAYAFGDKVVQYHMRPHQKPTSTLPKHPDPNFLRERLREDLGRQETAFDFMVQFQKDPVKMPVEDPMVAWDPRLSPYRKVATLRFPVQTFDSPAQAQFCENLSFNPWRTLPEHRPLGGINRARLRVYPAIARFRHDRNNVVFREPTPRDPSFAPER
ncbi:MAG TPA: catalase family protein [Thermoanaerobaculia bacterium]|nr:catalase family protein [Thermoanaerobaculia bacterium]